MKYIKIVLIALMAIVFFIPQGLAITVDGVKSPGEWNEDWAFCQDRNTSHPAPVFPYGDRLEVEQISTGVINAYDPPDDSGPNCVDSMATEGPFKSGYDFRSFYGHYDAINCDLYGMGTVYGKPGDLDGDNNISENCNGNGDCLGNPGPNGLLGVGAGETFTFTFQQGAATAAVVIGQDNNWSNGLVTFDYKDVEIAWTNDQPDGVDPEPVWEIVIHNASSYFDFNPGAENLTIKGTAGGLMDIPGEDTARVTMMIPGLIGDRVWFDGDCNKSNGLQDAGEPGIKNVKVSLYQHGGPFIKSTTTDANGYYLFEWLKPACYDIVIDPPAGLSAVDPNVGPDDTKDSDGINNRIDNVCLTPDKMVDLTNDFGFCEPPTVPALSPLGLMALCGLLGVIGIFGIRLKR